jgi:hypothetical protein
MLTVLIYNFFNEEAIQLDNFQIKELFKYFLHIIFIIVVLRIGNHRILRHSFF